MIWLLLACAGPDTAASVCDEEDRASVVVAGDSFDQDGVSVQVTALAPAPAQVGLNTWTLSATGVDADCTLSVTPFMPDHGHGSSIGAVDSGGDGTWTAKDLEFSMGGFWELQLAWQCETDTVTLTLPVCVDA